MKPIPTAGKAELRLGIIGSTEGNGHPFSWSAILNGYDKVAMARDCPFPGISAYLSREPKTNFGFPGVSVTHIHCSGDAAYDAEQVARCTGIGTIVPFAEDMIGAVDAVLVATDIGAEHVRRCRPFVEAGVPLFVDKPLVDSMADLGVFDSWIKEGRHILSSSCMRYAKEFIPYRLSSGNLGDLRFVTSTVPKKWETYGIHALEAVYPLVGPGFLTVRNTGTAERNIVHCTHRKGIDVVLAAIKDMVGGFGLLTLAGTEGADQLVFRDTFYAFKTQLGAFVDYLRSGVPPFPYAETHELMRVMIGAIESREKGGIEISTSESNQE